MVTFEQAYEIISTISVCPTRETTSLRDALGRVLAQEIIADADLPAFDRSAMDGYACRLADLDKPLTVLEVIAAGAWPTREIGAGECAKIMTGAPTPKGAELVIMVEDTLVNTDGTVSYTGKALPHTCDTAHKVPNNIRYRGEDLKAGDCILGGGQIINPAIVASLATIGCTHPEVFTRPKVAVISTGNELVEPGMSLREGTIRNSNGPQLVAQLLQSGAEPIYMGIAPDDKEATAAMLQQAMQQVDMILFSGGVSMGDFDFVPEVLVEAGFEIDFDSVAVQPGKPTLFAHKGAQFCFGLPGNPVSAYIQFELLVTPLICRMSGHTIHTKDILLPLADDFQRSKAKRHSWIPVAIINGTIHKIRYNGSGHISALAQADGFISFPIGISHLKKGELTNVRQI